MRYAETKLEHRCAIDQAFFNQFMRKHDMPGLKHFRHLKHEVIVFHVLDPREAEFRFEADATFRDMETGEQMTTEPFSIRGDYMEAVERWRAHLRRECAESRIDYVPFLTSTPYDRALFSYLEKRKRLS